MVSLFSLVALVVYLDLVLGDFLGFSLEVYYVTHNLVVVQMNSQSCYPHF